MLRRGQDPSRLLTGHLALDAHNTFLNVAHARSFTVHKSFGNHCLFMVSNDITLFYDWSVYFKKIK